MAGQSPAPHEVSRKTSLWPRRVIHSLSQEYAQPIPNLSTTCLESRYVCNGAEPCNGSDIQPVGHPEAKPPRTCGVLLFRNSKRHGPPCRPCQPPSEMVKSAQFAREHPERPCRRWTSTFHTRRLTPPTKHPLGNSALSGTAPNGATHKARGRWSQYHGQLMSEPAYGQCQASRSTVTWLFIFLYHSYRHPFVKRGVKAQTGPLDSRRFLHPVASRLPDSMG